MAKCSLDSWIRSWNRNRASVGKREKSGVQSIVLYQCQFLSFGKCSVIVHGVTIRGSWVKGRTLCTVFTTLL